MASRCHRFLIFAAVIALHLAIPANAEKCFQFQTESNCTLCSNTEEKVQCDSCTVNSFVKQFNASTPFEGGECAATDALGSQHARVVTIADALQAPSSLAAAQAPQASAG
eukprot:CAMPEP_0197859760 /NCGR_PEP_ID=MMETSP1438-20131217/34618_1 /TAXON_ID=1461541 /ORGANISM="Pterosperma sp., Strain CCMP1384" /LENGTH=109 /DNA_ID=CAMNT_0043476389 /DNA_START=177 /DNA_END=503 /DNA_ORIENTATION=+